MAGDLLLLDVNFNDKKTLLEAGASAPAAIYHSDRPWATYSSYLTTRLNGGAPSNRTMLPAHAYITFEARNRAAVQLFCQDKAKKARLNNVLVKCTRPLGIVSANQRLATWPGVGWEGAADILLAALNSGNVTIEYYKQDMSGVLDVFGRTWKNNPE